MSRLRFGGENPMACEDSIIEAISRGTLRIVKILELAAVIALLESRGLLTDPELPDEILGRDGADPGNAPEQEPREPFEEWLFRRVNLAMDAGDLPRDLLAEMQEEFGTPGERPLAVARAVVIRQIADLAGVDMARAAEAMRAIEIHTRPKRELLMRQIAEAWLDRRRRTYRRSET